MSFVSLKTGANCVYSSHFLPNHHREGWEELEKLKKALSSNTSLLQTSITALNPSRDPQTTREHVSLDLEIICRS